MGTRGGGGGYNHLLLHLLLARVGFHTRGEAKTLPGLHYSVLDPHHLHPWHFFPPQMLLLRGGSVGHLQAAADSMMMRKQIHEMKTKNLGAWELMTMNHLVAMLEGL